MNAPATLAAAPYDVEAIRRDFPILKREVYGKPLVYLDNGASAQKPQAVIDAVARAYSQDYANVHRGLHYLSNTATENYEEARETVRRFLNAGHVEEILFTRNATEAINLVAASYGMSFGAGDEIVLSIMEHHSNIVPWQLVAERTGARLRWFGLTDDGRLDLSDIDRLLTERTKVVSLVHVSNILGTVNPVAEIAARAHAVGALVVVDASQSVPQLPVDVTALGADFVAFTGHKMCGPTGIGVLWGRAELLAALPPFLGGGEMIETVTMARSTYAALPHKFEAGTPPIAPAIGLGAAVDYLSELGMDRVAAHERAVTAYALQRLPEVDGLSIIGPTVPVDRGGAVSFVLDGVHPHDAGQLLDELGVAVRVGHHCARPVCARYGVPATTRASFYVYSTPAEVDVLVEGLQQVRRFFGRVS